MSVSTYSSGRYAPAAAWDGFGQPHARVRVNTPLRVSHSLCVSSAGILAGSNGFEGICVELPVYGLTQSAAKCG